MAHPLCFEEDLAQRLNDAKPSMIFQGSTPEEFWQWHGRFKEKLVSLLGVIPERAGLDIVWGPETDCGSYVRHPLQYQSEAGVRVPAHLLAPRSATPGTPAPGMLCLHGHGQFGKDSVVGIVDTDERRSEVERLQYDYGRRFAEREYVVLAPDLRGFGERRPDYPGPRTDYCARNYFAAALLGGTVMGLQMCDLHAALDLLQSLDFVDGGRLGCAGLSYGGRTTMMISALDDRIGISIPSGCMNLYQERFARVRERMCGSQFIPQLLLYGDTPEIFSLIAPRPMVIEIGLSDGLIPHDWMERGLARIRKAYEAADAADRLWIDKFAAAHQFHFEVAITVVDRWRNGGFD